MDIIVDVCACACVCMCITGAHVYVCYDYSFHMTRGELKCLNTKEEETENSKRLFCSVCVVSV